MSVQREALPFMNTNPTRAVPSISPLETEAMLKVCTNSLLIKLKAYLGWKIPLSLPSVATPPSGPLPPTSPHTAAMATLTLILHSAMHLSHRGVISVILHSVTVLWNLSMPQLPAGVGTETSTLLTNSLMMSPLSRTLVTLVTIKWSWELKRMRLGMQSLMKHLPQAHLPLPLTVLLALPPPPPLPALAVLLHPLPSQWYPPGLPLWFSSFARSLCDEIAMDSCVSTFFGDRRLLLSFLWGGEGRAITLSFLTVTIPSSPYQHVCLKYNLFLSKAAVSYVFYIR